MSFGRRVFARMQRTTGAELILAAALCLLLGAVIDELAWEWRWRREATR